MSLYRLSIPVLCWLLLAIACGGPNTPLEADTRERIDSLATAAMRDVRVRLDSQCLLDRRQVMPQMVDSLVAVRRAQIEEKLRNVPN